MKKILLTTAILLSFPAFGGENTDATVSVVSTAGGTSVISGNQKRNSLCLQNAGTVALLCSKGANVPTATVYGIALKASTGANDGSGGQVCFSGPGSAASAKWTCIAASGTGSCAVSSLGY